MSESTKRARVLYTADQVQEKIDVVAAQAIERYQGKDPIFVILMNGAMPFATDLLRSIREQVKEGDLDLDPKMASMIVSTYGHGKEPKQPRIVADLPPPDVLDVEDRTVVIVDDVHDSGRTLSFVDKHISRLGASCVESLVLVQKTGPSEHEIYYPDATLSALTSPRGEWLIGMGMDGDPNANQGSDAARWETEILVVEDVGFAPAD